MESEVNFRPLGVSFAQRCRLWKASWRFYAKLTPSGQKLTSDSIKVQCHRINNVKFIQKCEIFFQTRSAQFDETESFNARPHKTPFACQRLKEYSTIHVFRVRYQ